MWPPFRVDFPLNADPGAIASIEYIVDGRGRRVAKRTTTVSGTTAMQAQWIYRDQLNPVAQLDGQGNLQWQFVYATRRNVPDLMVRWSGGAPVIYKVIADHLGSPRVVVNVADVDDKLLVATYDPFGRRNVVLADSSDPDAVPFGFAGGLLDSDTGLIRFGARDYDPETGTWTAKDLMRFEGGGANLYAYCHGDPTNLFDLTGTAPITTWGGFFRALLNPAHFPLHVAFEALVGREAIWPMPWDEGYEEIGITESDLCRSNPETCMSLPPTPAEFPDPDEEDTDPDVEDADRDNMCATDPDACVCDR